MRKNRKHRERERERERERGEERERAGGWGGGERERRRGEGGREKGKLISRGAKQARRRLSDKGNEEERGKRGGTLTVKLSPRVADFVLVHDQRLRHEFVGDGLEAHFVGALSGLQEELEGLLGVVRRQHRDGLVHETEHFLRLHLRNV